MRTPEAPIFICVMLEDRSYVMNYSLTNLLLSQVGQSLIVLCVVNEEEKYPEDLEGANE